MCISSNAQHDNVNRHDALLMAVEFHRLFIKQVYKMATQSPHGKIDKTQTVLPATPTLRY